MTTLQLSMVQMASAHMEPTANIDQIESWVAGESEAGSGIVVFPELATTGYLEPVTPDDAYSPDITGDKSREAFTARFASLAETVPGPTTQRLSSIARKYQTSIILGMLEKVPGANGLLANTVAAIDGQGVIGCQRKLHMPWNEKHVFMPGNEISLLNVGGLRVGINVCYDAYFPEQSRVLALKGADLIVSCFTGPQRVGGDHRVPTDRAQVLARARAIENSLYFGAVNRVGRQGAYRFIGNSAIAGPDGGIVASTDSFEPQGLRAEIDTQKIVQARLGLAPIRDRRPELYADVISPWDTIPRPSEPA